MSYILLRIRIRTREAQNITTPTHWLALPSGKSCFGSDMKFMHDAMEILCPEKKNRANQLIRRFLVSHLSFFFIILVLLDEFSKVKFIGLTRNWTQVTCLAVSHYNHYTRMFSVLVWSCNWILFMHGWWCPIHLIHLIGRKSLHFEKTRQWSLVHVLMM